LPGWGDGCGWIEREVVIIQLLFYYYILLIIYNNKVSRLTICENADVKSEKLKK
jgi:hypothetical protein